MPSKQQHLDKATHNETFYDDFDLDSSPIYNKYIALKDKCRDARYEAIQFGACDVRKLQKERFLPAKNHLVSLL